MAEAAPVRHLVVAVVRRPHGVRGELQLALETDRPDAVFRRGRVLQLGDARGRPAGEFLTVDKARPIKDGLILKAEEHASRDDVEALRGRTLLIPTEESAPGSADEVPYHQLVGCTVLVAGEPVGVVGEVLEAGGGQLLAVRRRPGGELLVPFVREMLTRVDLQRREIEIVPPEGLLDL